MSGTITLDQFKALLKEELTPLKEAAEANTARLTSMESKMEAHDASFGDVKLRLGVLEDAPVHSKVKEHIKSAVATESQSFMEDKEAALSSLVASTANQIKEIVNTMNATHDIHTTRLLDQFLKHTASAH